jgi:hypothetical protein
MFITLNDTIKELRTAVDITFILLLPPLLVGVPCIYAYVSVLRQMDHGVPRGARKVIVLLGNELYIRYTSEHGIADGVFRMLQSQEIEVDSDDTAVHGIR